MASDHQLETQLMHFAEDREKYHGAVVPPIFQNSLFTFENWEAIDKAFEDRTNNCIYTRGKNPSVSLVEEKIALLAGGERAKLFGSGMAAISAAILHFLKPGDHVITIKNIYGPTNNLLNTYLRKKMNIETTYIDGGEATEFESAIQKNTRLIYLESPSSAVFRLQDIAAVARFSREKGIKTIIDNTWATPIFQKPLAMGVDLEVHSCSKYLGGHSDVVAGVVIGSEKDIIEISVNEFELLGGKMAPFEAWLILRSLRTLPIRMLKHQENAMNVAAFLESHSKIRKVNYPGLADFAQKKLAEKQMTGFSGLLSFELATRDVQQIKNFFNALQIFQIGVSWGGHESLIYAPAISYLKELPADQFKNLGISVGDMRISVGLENSDDLINDLEQALAQLG
ncbi:MAG: aminotransferase class V-fold PLP-dependent enzyme [Calditrichaeota bacterium]|nr:MAG: aminotransferase class V-fold PLP-dependent enzyme [Calditrichota bacterium]